MACSKCAQQSFSFLNMNVKYSFNFVNFETLELVLKSIFETPEKVIQDCEGVFKIKSDEICIEKPILARKRDDEYRFSDGYDHDDGAWRSLLSCIFEEMKNFRCKENIEIYLEFRVTECTTLRYYKR